MKILEIFPLQKSVTAKIAVPGSKSYTNRALLLAALSPRPVKVINPLISNDTKTMVNCLRKLGIKIIMKDNFIEVANNITSAKNLSYDLDANESGTTIRFMLALSAIIPGVKTLYGKEGLNKRPVGNLVEGLKQLGARIEYLKRKGYPPLRVLSSKLHPGTIKIKGSVSSQYISALLMVAPLVGRITIEVTGDQVSKPYIDMTIDIMEKFGAKVKNDNYKKYLISANQKYHTKEYLVEGDLSSAGYFLAIAALTRSTITLKNINPYSKQADMQFVKILENMGNKISYGKNEITITGVKVKPVSLNLQDCPDQIQTMAVLASFAKGVTKISGIASLRIKETDRVAALITELKKMGIKTSVTKNILTIYGGSPKAACIKTYGDHRMAMAFAVAGAKLPGMQITDPAVVNKTFPDFWKKLNYIGIKTKPVQENIILIGMRGSGKTTIAKILAKKLNRDLIETDELVAEKANLNLPEIIKNFGWNKFRELETEAVKQVATCNSSVISTGGGIVLKDHNIKLLKKSGTIFYLRSQIPVLIKRAGHDPNRPPLTDKKTAKEEMEQVLKQRKKIYESSADHIIDTDNLDPEETTDLILYKYEFRTCHCEPRRGAAILINKDSHGRLRRPRNDRSCEVCLVIGDPIKQSLSPYMHNAGYKALGIDNQFVFIAEKVTKKNLKSALEKIKTAGIRGVSVTVPHKQNAMKYLDKVDKIAKKIGAVNTIVNSHGKLTGYNTDWIGAVTALEQKTKIKDKKVAVIGAGGAARAIVYGLTKSNAVVVVFNRTLKRAKKLAEDFGCRYVSLDALEEISKMDIIINATPIGMTEDKNPIDKRFLNRNQIIFDVVYSPSETRLIKDARKIGAKVILGYEMLLYQGIVQFELYTGLKAPIEAMRKALEKNLDEN